MRQYLSFKEKHPDAILFFRMGDFYEMFFADAELAARELGLTLTSRDKGREGSIPMAGVPHHAAEGYIARLVRKGYRVAVCEQLGDPAKTRGIVERGVVEVITPGTALSDALVSETANNYVAAAHRARDVVGFAAADITTGEFFLEDFPLERFEQDVARLSISEWVVPEGEDLFALPQDAAPPVRRPGWWFDEARGRRELEAHFGVQSLAASTARISVRASAPAARSSTTCAKCAGPSCATWCGRKRLGARDFMVLDATTRRNLELTAPLLGEGRDLTLLGAIDRTLTSLGRAPGARVAGAPPGATRADRGATRRGRGVGESRRGDRSPRRDAAPVPRSRATPGQGGVRQGLAEGSARARRGRAGHAAAARAPRHVPRGGAAGLCRERAGPLRPGPATRRSPRGCSAPCGGRGRRVSTGLERGARRASRPLPRRQGLDRAACRSRNARRPVSPRSRWATTGCSATTSRSPPRIRTRCRRTTSASRPSSTPSVTSPRS